MDTVLKFSVDKIEFIEEMNDMLFRKARIRAFATGENAHTLPIDEDVLKRGATTIYNKPILWKYNPYLDDAMGHEEDEVPCGFVPEKIGDKDNLIEFEKDSDGRIFIVITAYIWTKYSGKLVEIFERDNSRKDVSIEIVIVDADDRGFKPKILDFVIAGITILGEMVNPACKGCRAELLAFSEDKKKYEEQYFDESSIKIDNSKESATNGTWSNPRKKLFNPIISASNTTALFNEAYLINLNNSKDSNMIDHKYPHHVIKNNKLIVHKDGLEAAFQRAAQQGIVRGDVKAHLLKHYRELGLTTENFSEFNITEKQFNEYFSEDIINNSESVGDRAMNMDEKKELLCSYFANFTFSDGEDTVEKYSVEEVNEDTVVCTDKEDGCKYSIAYAISDDKEVTADMSMMTKMGDVNTEGAAQVEEIKKEEEQHDEESQENTESTTEEMSEESHDENVDDETHEDGEPHEEIHESEEDDNGENCEHHEETFEEKYNALCDRFAQLETENKAYMAKIEEMADYAELKKFKEDTLAKEKREEEMAQMNAVMSDIENRGVKMSEDEKKELMDRVAEFSSMDAWANFAKAQVFDRVENIEGVLKIGMPFSNKKKTSNSIWDRI
jgi:hypothetical protein